MPILRWLPGLFGLATLGALIYALVEREWLFAGVALAFGVIETYVLARMTGPFDIQGRGFRFRGSLVGPATGSSVPPPPPPEPPEAPPQIPPETTPQPEDQGA